MSEAHLKLKVIFKDETTASAVASELRGFMPGDNSLDSKELFEWSVELVRRSKKKLTAELLGPPSLTDFDPVVKWLVDKNAIRIDGAIWTDQADFDPYEFIFRGGKYVAPKVDLAKIIKNHPSKGEGINKVDGADNTPLHYAVEYGREKIVRALLVAGADIDGLARADNTGALCTRASPLMDVPWGEYETAVKCRIIRMLLDYGANWRMTNQYGENVVDLAITTCDTNLVTFLIEKGCSPAKYKNSINYDLASLKPLLIRVHSLMSGKVDGKYWWLSHVADLFQQEQLMPLYGDGPWRERMVGHAIGIGSTNFDPQELVNVS